ncbi:MAG: BRCT domain-containing protein, partial [Myxococcota bacterium]
VRGQLKIGTNMAKAPKVPAAIRKVKKSYDYRDPTFEDGIWVFNEMGTAHFKKDQGWVMHYDKKGNEIRSLFYEKNKLAALSIENDVGEATLYLKKSVQEGRPNTGKIQFHDSALAVAQGIAGVKSPSEEVQRIEFAVASFDRKTYSFEIANPVYYDAQGNKLSAQGGHKDAPTATAILVTGDGRSKLWRDDEAGGKRTIYDLNGDKTHEEHYDRGNRVAVTIYSKKGSYEWHEKDGSVRFTKGKRTYTLRRTRGGPVVEVATSQGKEQIKTPKGIKTPKEFKKHFKVVYAPFLAQGVRMQDDPFFIDGEAVVRYRDVVDLWTILNDYGGNELVYVGEPGPHQGKVFWNDHEEGLFGLEMLEEYVEEEGIEYEDASSLIEMLPFFTDEKRALLDVFKALEWLRPESDLAFLDSLVPLAEPSKKESKKRASGKLKRTVGKTFLFTGKLAAMKRADGKRHVAELGGSMAGSVSKNLDYLVVGDDGSPLYGQGKKGSKLVAAEKLVAQGAPLQIVSETEFLAMKRK